MPTLKLCIDCGTLTPSVRCPACESARNRARDAARGNTTARTYGNEHQKIRAALLPLAYGRPCPRCGRAMYRWQALDLGHSTPTRKTAGLPGDRIEHAACNRGNR